MIMMEDEDDKKKKEKKDPFDELFDSPEMNKEIKKMQKLAEEIMKRSLQDLDQNPFVYGFSVGAGPNGSSKIKKFGNTMDHFDKDKDSEWTPLSDVQNCGDEVLVTVDLPGVEKEDIDLKAVERKLIIDVDGARKYHTEIRLPSEVEMDDSEATYRNGVLEIRLKKSKDQEHYIEVK